MKEIDPRLALQALTAGLARHPGFAAHEPRVTWVKVFRGETLRVVYGGNERPGGPDAWEFQDLVIQEYRRLSGAG